jgi:hypothetical protein
MKRFRFFRDMRGTVKKLGADGNGTFPEFVISSCQRLEK